MTALQYFRLLASAFACVDDATVQKWITVAGNFVGISGLTTEQANQAQALYAAHLLALATPLAAGESLPPGPVTSEKEGDLQRTYGQMKNGDTYLGQTPYGLQYIELTRGAFGSAIMTRVSA